MNGLLFYGLIVLLFIVVFSVGIELDKKKKPEDYINRSNSDLQFAVIFAAVIWPAVILMSFATSLYTIGRWVGKKLVEGDSP